MRIGFDAKRAFYNHRGLGQYSRNLLLGLSEYAPEHHFFLYTPFFNKEKNQYQNKYSLEIKTPEGPLKYVPSVWRSMGLGFAARKDNISVFHGLSHELPFFMESSTKKIVTVHDLIPWRYPDLFSWIDRQAYKLKIIHSVRAADRIIATSHQTKNDLLNFLQVDEKKITVCYQCCHPRFYSDQGQEKNSILENKKISPGYILYVGALEERKNIIQVIRSLRQSKTSPSLVLVGQGRGDYVDKIKKEIDILGLRDKVSILDDIKDADLVSIYQHAKIFIYLSHFEGFGIPLIEARFSGVPIITANNSSLVEICGEGAIRVSPDNVRDTSEAIDYILSDEKNRLQMAELGKKNIRQFHIKETTKKLLDIYNEVLN